MLDTIKYHSNEIMEKVERISKNQRYSSTGHLKVRGRRTLSESAIG